VCWNQQQCRLIPSSSPKFCKAHPIVHWKLWKSCWKYYLATLELNKLVLKSTWVFHHVPRLFRHLVQPLFTTTTCLDLRHKFISFTSDSSTVYKFTSLEISFTSDSSTVHIFDIQCKTTNTKNKLPDTHCNFISRKNYMACATGWCLQIMWFEEGKIKFCK